MGLFGKMIAVTARVVAAPVVAATDLAMLIPDSITDPDKSPMSRTRKNANKAISDVGDALEDLER